MDRPLKWYVAAGLGPQCHAARPKMPSANVTIRYRGSETDLATVQHQGFTYPVTVINRVQLFDEVPYPIVIMAYCQDAGLTFVVIRDTHGFFLAQAMIGHVTAIYE